MAEKTPGKDLIDSLDGQLRVEKDNNRLVVSNGLTDVMLAGVDDSGEIVIKIAKPGFDVKTAANDELIFNSAQNVLKVVASGVANFTVPDPAGSLNDQVVTIPHGLPSPPAVLAYIPVLRDDTIVGIFWTPLPYTNSVDLFASAVSDETNVYITESMLTGGTWGTTSLNIRYYILQETAN